MRYLAATLLLGPVLWPGVVWAAININGAAFADLDALPGVGEVTANRLIDYRENNGAFSSISQVCALVGTNGIGEETQTCKNIEAEIYFGPLGTNTDSEDDKEEEDNEEADSDADTDSDDKDSETAKPVTGLTLKVPNVVYAGQLVFFDVNPTDGTADRLVRYSWNFGDGHASKEKSPAHQYSRPGNYVVAVESYFQKETKFARREIKVLPLMLKVTPIGGGVEITNEGEYELDLGGLSIEGVGGFTFAKHTILLPSERVVVDGVSGPSVTIKDAVGKTLRVEAKPPEKTPLPAPTKKAAVSAKPKASAQSVAIIPTAEAEEPKEEASTTPMVENTAAVSNAMIPAGSWPYLGLLTVMTFGFIALFGVGKFI